MLFFTCFRFDTKWVDNKLVTALIFHVFRSSFFCARKFVVHIRFVWWFGWKLRFLCEHRVFGVIKMYCCIKFQVELFMSLQCEAKHTLASSINKPTFHFICNSIWMWLLTLQQKISLYVQNCPTELQHTKQHTEPFENNKTIFMKNMVLNSCSQCRRYTQNALHRLLLWSTFTL